MKIFTEKMYFEADYENVGGSEKNSKKKNEMSKL
jgi:hypothetical protein